jgi:Aldehyde dehydrogenase family
MVKPSELTPRFSAALRTAVVETFAGDEVTVVTGDPTVGKAFAALPFDHLVFTGSTTVGREVAQAAAKNLTPRVGVAVALHLTRNPRHRSRTRAVAAASKCLLPVSSPKPGQNAKTKQGNSGNRERERRQPDGHVVHIQGPRSMPRLSLSLAD